MESENATASISDLEKEVEKMLEKLPEEERVLEQIKESSKGIFRTFILLSMWSNTPLCVYLI